jgi:hypothetical protein
MTANTANTENVTYRMFESPYAQNPPVNMEGKKIITAYKIYENSNLEIARGRLSRPWMDDTSDKFAYRCLPLNIANMHGWAFHLKKQIVVEWNGKPGIDAIKIIDQEENNQVVSSHFGSGILTFSIDHLFKTPENYSLYITGAPNHFIPGAHALTGVYESDWAPYSFTMNWKLTDPHRKIIFNLDDPICFIFPVQRELIEDFVFEVRDLNSIPELGAAYDEFKESRNNFIESIKNKTNKDSWQRNYFQGKMPSGSKCPVHNHKTKLSLNFEEK